MTGATDLITTADVLQWVIAALGFILSLLMGQMARSTRSIAKDVSDMKITLSRHDEKTTAHEEKIRDHETRIRVIEQWERASS